MLIHTKLFALAVAWGLTAPAFSQQVNAPTSPTEVTVPAEGVKMHPEYAKVIGRMAYVWGWPMVNMLNRHAAITQAPEPGRLNGVGPQSLFPQAFLRTVLSC